MALLINLQSAKEWAATSEKWSYCVELLDISGNHPNVETLVGNLEDRFQTILLNESHLERF